MEASLNTSRYVRSRFPFFITSLGTFELFFNEELKVHTPSAFLIFSGFPRFTARLETSSSSSLASPAVWASENSLSLTLRMTSTLLVSSELTLYQVKDDSVVCSVSPRYHLVGE